jgi:hypothetical protein
MKKILLFVPFMVAAALVTAQGTVEALRFSQVYHSGTARFSAMGGAFAALGGDASALTYNPGGLGVYRSTEFSFTPHLLNTKTEASYMGNSLSDNKFKFGMSNLAGIAAFELNSSSLKYLNFGIVYNKTNHYTAASMLRGKDYTDERTVGDYFALLANNAGVPPQSLPQNDIPLLAYDGWVIDYDTANNNYTVPYKKGEAVVNEQRSYVSGTMGEYDFSMGGNIADIFYFGITVGVVDIEYEETTTISEYSTTLTQFDYTQNFHTKGGGFNFKLGFVTTPLINADFGSGLRIGAAFHTPTFLTLSDYYDARIKTTGYDPASYDLNEFEYLLETPYRYMVGLAYVFTGSPLRGIISADYEYVDYSQIKMREYKDYRMDNILDINDAITKNFNSASNIRVGGELGYKQVSFRAGYAHYGNSYQSAAGKNSAVNMLSLGIGIKYGRNAFIDFAYTRAMQSDKDYLYYDTISGLRSDEAKYDITQNNFLITFGWRF